jgi:hypothetical protein
MSGRSLLLMLALGAVVLCFAPATWPLWAVAAYLLAIAVGWSLGTDHTKAHYTKVELSDMLHRKHTHNRED